VHTATGDADAAVSNQLHAWSASLAAMLNVDLLWFVGILMLTGKACVDVPPPCGQNRDVVLLLDFMFRRNAHYSVSCCATVTC